MRYSAPGFIRPVWGRQEVRTNKEVKGHSDGYRKRLKRDRNMIKRTEKRNYTV